MFAMTMPLFSDFVECFSRTTQKVTNYGWRMTAAFVIALSISAVFGPWWLRKLRTYKLEQIQRNQKEVRELAQLHKDKDNTPTMGGAMIVASALIGGLIATLISELPDILGTQIHISVPVFTIIGGTLAMAIAGAYDDLAKIKRGNARGLSGTKKLLIQFAITVIVWAILKLDAKWYQVAAHPMVPFLHDRWEMADWIFPIYIFFVLAGTSNAVNVTDGLDGLATGCAIPVVFFLGLMCYVHGAFELFSKLGMRWVPGIEDIGIMCASVLGALVVFLWHNCYPAKIFMGDTGSLALGMFIGLAALLSGFSLFLVVAGGVFVLEALSDIIQVFSYKFCGKRRVFKMAPIHHHFELSGMHETRVTLHFWLISAALCAIATLGAICIM